MFEDLRWGPPVPEGIAAGAGVFLDEVDLGGMLLRALWYWLMVSGIVVDVFLLASVSIALMGHTPLQG